MGRVVESGKPLFLNDHVTTDMAGKLQVMLLDETVFTLGPNSDMVLDEFVYDPANGSGKVAARVTKGVFRFVTGKVAQRDPANMRVKLPVGTLGIRGTMAIGAVEGGKETAILLGPGGRGNSDESRGAITFDGKLIDRPGHGVSCSGGKCSGVIDKRRGGQIQRGPGLRGRSQGAEDGRRGIGLGHQGFRPADGFGQARRRPGS